MSFLSDRSYREFLEQHVRLIDDAMVRDHVMQKYATWSQQYRGHRLLERTSEQLGSERKRPNVLYLSCEMDLELLTHLAQRHHFDETLFRGFLVEDRLWGQIKPEWFAPFPVYRTSEWRDSEETVVFTFSDSRPFRDNGRDRGNDYQERFVDLSRLSFLTDIRQQAGDRPVVLYADYRKVKTFEALAEAVSDRYTTVGLISDPTIKNSGYDHLIREPHCYLWPIIIKTLDPDVVHVNVGWATQGTPFLPFVSDPARAVVDFYDVLALMEDKYLYEHHPEPYQMTRASENYLWTHANHFIHRNGSAVTDGLLQKYPGKDVVSVLEYLKEPVCSQKSEKASELKLVYGGIIIQDPSDRESVYYRRFQAMVDYFAQDNLHLYVYPSPYLYGFGPAKAVETLARTQGLTNVHACNALEEDEWVREIAKCDFGIFIFGDTHPAPCPHILPFKFITFLRAGLPMIVPEDQTLMADLVRDNNIGVVYRREDRDRMPEILAQQDINALKENVVRFRSSMSITKGGEKVGAMYDRILEAVGGKGKTMVRAEKASLAAGTVKPENVSSPRSELALEGRTFLPEAEYTRFLEARLAQAGPGKDREYVQRRFQGWAQCYHIERMRQRAEELLSELQGRPFSLYLDGPLSLQAAAHLLEGASAKVRAGLKGFVVEDDFLATQDIRMFQPYPASPRSRSQEIGTAVFSMSGNVPNGCAGTYLANDYREKFIDLRRFGPALEQRRNLEPHPVVLYPLYREIHTVSIMAQSVRRMDDQLRGFSLSPRPLLDDHFDAMLVEPYFYLWPLIFQMLDPDLVHLNVGWGIQALALSPFIPDRRRTVVDFYEVLGFLPDVYFNKTHSTAEEVRFGEAHFVENYDHVMHLCSEEISTKLADKYDTRGSIISVTEYLEKPTYDTPSADDGIIRMVYGGCMLATNNPDDLYYKAFIKVAPHFARENLHLYIYNSPYVHGIVENDGLKDVLQRQGLTNVHACKPLKLEDFVRKISEYDYGAMLLRPKDMDGLEYNYFMATKFLTYLRAGLPVLIETENYYMAGLVERYNIGLVLSDCDLPYLADTLNTIDYSSLKQNVIKFRDEFSIDKGGAKVLDMYHTILEQSGRKRVFPVGRKETKAPEPAEDHSAYDELISSMARAENRLYYRDQSSHTMASLARHARDLDPTVIVELGTLAGLSLRTWVSAAKRAKIYAVDLSFAKLRETMKSLPVNLSRVTLVEQDILKTDFASMWTRDDKVIFFVDAHDLPNVPIMDRVLTTVLPSLPDGSMVIVDDLWFSKERLTHDSARTFLEGRVVGQIDELQCFEGHYAPYHEGGSFMGFAEVVPLLDFVNDHGIKLIHDEDSKHVSFVWKKAYLSRRCPAAERPGERGCVVHNPLAYVPTLPELAEQMQSLIADYRRGRVREVAQRLVNLVTQHPQDAGLAYGLAVCMARGGLLQQARDVLASGSRNADHPRYRKLLDDLVDRVEPREAAQPQAPQPRSQDEQGMTIFAMPKAFTGHIATIQKNAIRSWAGLKPTPEIILFGDEPGIREIAEEVGAKHVPQVDRNEFETPLVNKLFEAAEAHASHEILAYVNADMILFQSFADGTGKVQAELSEFLLIGQRWDIPILDEIDFGDPQWQRWLQEQMQEHAIVHAECGLDYFVFRRGLYREIPPFAIGRTAWDNWLVMAPHTYGAAVVDGTEFITAVHQDHDYGHVPGGRHEAWKGVEAARNHQLIGMTDNSGRTSGATWILTGDGTLKKSPPREPWHLTTVYRRERTDWLLRQADRLVSLGRHELAGCKWEESLALQETLLAIAQQSDAADIGQLVQRYATTFISLAQCYAETGHPELVVDAYSRLLDNPRLRIPKAQRAKFAQQRDKWARRIEKTDETAGEAVTAACRNVSRDARSNGMSHVDNIAAGPAGTRPKVSVITACRNAERYLPECLDSILRQTLVEWELFLLDDQSTDGTRRIIEEYARRDGRIRPFYFDDKAGPYCRRNFAIERAKAPFIVIQDADDIMCPEKLERLYGAIIQDDRLGVVGSFYSMFVDEYQGAEHCEEVVLATSHEQILEQYRASGICNFCAHGSAIIRRQLFLDIGPYDENPFASDSYWLTKALEYAWRTDEIRLKNIPEVLTLRRMHVGSQTGSLPTFDPRSRRVRFREYRAAKLAEAVQRLNSNPRADVKAELRRAVCSDFVAKYGHLFKEWESAPLTSQIVHDFLGRIYSHFARGRFVRCIVMSQVVEQLVEGISESVRSYDLVRGLAFFALGCIRESRECLDREWHTHKTPFAARFRTQYVDRNQGRLTRAERVSLIEKAVLCEESMGQPKPIECLLDRSVSEAPQLSVVVSLAGDATAWTELIASFDAQTEKRFEVIALTRGTRREDLESLSNRVRFPLTILAAGQDAGRWQLRNAAADQAKGRYVAFLDEHVLPESDFVERVAAHFEENDICGLRGRIVCASDSAHPVRFDLGPEAIYAACDADELCVFEKDAFVRLGGFRPTAFDHEAIQLSYQIYTDPSDHRRPILYCPDVVAHYSGPQEPRAGLVDRFAVENRFTVDRLMWSKPPQESQRHNACGFLAFVEGFHQVGESPQEEQYRQALDNSLFFRKRYPRLAIEWAERTLRCRPDSIKARYVMGYSYAMLNRPEDACATLEEMLDPSERLLDLRQMNCASYEFMAYGDIVECYVAACTLLAECCLKTGQHDRAAAIYVRLLESPHVDLDPSQRQSMERMRDRLVHSPGERTESTLSGRVGCEGKPEQTHPVWPEISGPAMPAQTPACQPESEDTSDERHAQVLADLERRYRAMPRGARGRRAAAIRLAELFRRAGWADKSRALEVEARDAESPAPVPVPVPHPSAAKVAVVVACHNARQYLAECLDSIRNQTLKEWELFLLDDGSTDGTRQIIEAYAAHDARIRPFYFDNSTGPYVRRNFAIRQTNAPFVTIQDADDIMCPDKLLRLYEAITDDERLGIVGSFYRKFLDEFDRVERTEAVILPTTHEKILDAYGRRLVWDFSWHGSAMARRDLFDQIGLYDENPFGADSFWLAKAAEYARHTGMIRLRNIPEFLTLRRVHGASQTGRLPTIDPRGRRARYWKYCLGRLQEATSQAAHDSHADFARALRDCTCSDFLQRFGAQIATWESERLNDLVVPHFLQRALQCFNERQYVTCVQTLNGLETMDSTIPGHVPNFDLVRAMALHGLGLMTKCQVCLRREMVNHNNPLAQAFHEAVFERSTPVDVQKWCDERLDSLTLRATDAVRLKATAAAGGRTGTLATGSPKVSVITACRNAERFLTECLDSILSQTLTEWELFLLDDGSTDGTRQIIEAYAARDARIRPFYFDRSAGPYVRRNVAIRQAGAPLVAIQDADDIMCPDKLLRLYEAINEDERLGIVGSFYRKFLDRFTSVEYSEAVILPTTHEEILNTYRRLVWDFSWHGSAIARRDLFDLIGLYDENPFGADSFWLAKVAEYARHTGKIRLRNIPEFLTLRRMHGGSQIGRLSVFDPRNRRARYWKYCECKLRRLRDRMASESGMDVGREFRECTCSDFLTRFRAQIFAWENESLDERIVPALLKEAVSSFNRGSYVSCASILHNVESFDPAAKARVMGYDLLRGMALFAMQIKDKARLYLESEIQRHNNVAAQRFLEDAFESEGSVDVQSWCEENAGRLDIGLKAVEPEGSGQTAFPVGAIQEMDCRL